MKNCCAICVTYNPDLFVLKKTISSTLSQVDRVYVIDNGSSVAFDSILTDHKTVESVFLNKNLGIAAGFNVGIQSAKKAGYKYVLLLDQDSIPPEGMVDRYLEVMHEKSKMGTPVAAVGPRYRNTSTGHTSRFVRFNWFRNSYHLGSKGSPVVATDFLISSGSFYAMNVFDKVGVFDEELFIDHVDTEWFLRARRLGFLCFGVEDVVIEHTLGEGGLRLWFFKWRTQPIHKPFRLYYIARNSLLLYQMKHVPWKWISGDILRLFRLMTVYLIFLPNRIQSMGFFGRGLVDGIKKVVGPSPHSR